MHRLIGAIQISPPNAAADQLPLQVLELDTLPSVVTLIGGGYIGMEFAGRWHLAKQRVISSCTHGWDALHTCPLAGYSWGRPCP